MKVETAAYIVFGPNTLRFETIDSTKEKYAVLEIDTGLQAIGLNSAVITFNASNTTVYDLSPSKDPLKITAIPLSEAIDEFGLKAIKNDSTLMGNEKITPLFLLVRSEGKLYSYSFLLSHTGELLFVCTGIHKITSQTFGINSLRDNIENAYGSFKANNYKLNNYNAIYSKNNPDKESEYKLTLPENTDLWMLHEHFIAALRKNEIKGFTLNSIHGIRRWTFKNYLYEITDPISETGYISFILNPDGTYIIKHKIYQIDQLHRTELRTRNVHIHTSFEDYLAEKYPNLKFKKYPMFERLFYSFVMDSLDTGNNYAVIFDRNYVEGHESYPHLVQCEIEYYNSLTLKEAPDSEKELGEVTDIFRRHLADLTIPYVSDFYSKLSYLKDVTANTVPNASIPAQHV